MLQRTLRTLTFACGVMAVLAMPTESRAACRLIDCLFGTAPAASSATTYAPPYVPAPVYAAPACQPCATVAPVAAPCSTPCVQSCKYMPAVAPTVAYRPYVAYAPVVAAAYRPVAYQPVVGSYAVTTYRPFLGTYQTRFVPYTTYRPYYAPGIAYAAYTYSPVVSYGSCGCGSSGCSSCGSCGYSSCGSCQSGACGSVIYEARLRDVRRAMWRRPLPWRPAGRRFEYFAAADF